MKTYIVSHTHWDREWYQTFQDYRARLVALLDELIAFMEKNPAFAYYHLDGQTIVLEDYLEVRPENRKRLQRLIKQGRIIPGPWYVMPDEFLVSGEALIRNLQLGSSISRTWGVEPMKVGYIVDIFGHNSQMPQICQGFGMESVVAFRGVSGTESSAEFIWEGEDGSSVIFYRLPDETAGGGRVPGQRVQSVAVPTAGRGHGCRVPGRLPGGFHDRLARRDAGAVPAPFRAAADADRETLSRYPRRQLSYCADRPANDRLVTGLSEVSVKVTVSGPLVASAVVSGTLTVPAGLTPDQKGRSAETVSVRLFSTFTIRRGSRRVDVRTEIENNARDHVLKALFPARTDSWESSADSMFDVLRRDIRPPSGVVFEEPWQENRPLESFVGISDSRRGLVVFAKGLHEGGVRNDDARSVFLTVLRCYGRTVLTPGEEGGQMLGRQTVEYAFMPVRDQELPAVLAEREQFLHVEGGNPSRPA